MDGQDGQDEIAQVAALAFWSPRSHPNYSHRTISARQKRIAFLRGPQLSLATLRFLHFAFSPVVGNEIYLSVVRHFSQGQYIS
jgi:hypothetical protein